MQQPHKVHCQKAVMILFLPFQPIAGRGYLINGVAWVWYCIQFTKQRHFIFFGNKNIQIQMIAISARNLIFAIFCLRSRTFKRKEAQYFYNYKLSNYTEWALTWHVMYRQILRVSRSVKTMERHLICRLSFFLIGLQVVHSLSV